MKYSVGLTCRATMGAFVSVEAESEDQAKAKAVQIAKDGDVHWSYDGADDATIEAFEISEG